MNECLKSGIRTASAGYHRVPAWFLEGINWEFVPQNSQRNILFPWTVFPHSNPESGAEEKFSCRHQIALLRRLELQHSAVPDEGMKLTVGGRRGIKINRCRWTALSTVLHLWSTTTIFRKVFFVVANCVKSLLVSDGLDGLSSALIVVFLHVSVHGAQLHLPSEVDIHRTLLHCGVDELIWWVTQLEANTAEKTGSEITWRITSTCSH